MSINYYAFGPFPGGDTNGEGLHIGQAAGGTRFLFRAHPELGLTSYADWSQFIRRPNVVVRAESGYDLTPEQMDNVMTEARDNRGWPLRAREGAVEGKPGYHRDGPHAFLDADFC